VLISVKEEERMVKNICEGSNVIKRKMEAILSNLTIILDKLGKVSERKRTIDECE
jgi:hypothetical protein